jgi:hypothetical protein
MHLFMSHGHGDHRSSTNEPPHARDI